VHIADRPIGQDLATLVGLFAFDDALAETVHRLYGQPAASTRTPAAAARPEPGPLADRGPFRTPTPTRDELERLCDLGVLSDTGGNPTVAAIGDAIEAGWQWREREARALFEARQWEAAAQHAHFLATASAMAADVSVIRPSDEDEWFAEAILRVRHAVNAVPPVPAPLVRMAASWTAADVQLTNIARNGATMASTCDWSRLTQFRERAYEGAVIQALPGSTLSEGRVALRLSVLDDDLTLIPTSVTTGTGITVVRSRQFANFARHFIAREARPVVLTGAPDLEPLAMAVLRLLAAGAKDDAIARKLAVSDRTVRRLIAMLMRELAAESRFQLGLRAARAGLV
jgi:DNA-binding CsgD family transcriptional regulator